MSATSFASVTSRLEALGHDLRLALRALVRDRSFTLATLLMLSLCIALNATAFRVLNTMLLRGYPLVKDNERLLYIDERSPQAGCCVSYFDFEHWRREAHAFEDMAFMAPRSISLAEGNGDARTVWATAWTANSFRLLGVSPVLGRDFEPADAVPGAPPVVVASYGYWAVIAPIYATLALLLAAIGLYAVVARSVGQRRTEMGIRMALGATPWKIRRLVFVEGMAPVVAGLVLGLAASIGMNRIVQSQLVGVSPYDALTMSVAPLILIAVASVGCLRPAHLAMRVDPAEALRQG